MDKSVFTENYKKMLHLLIQLRVDAGLRQTDLAEMLDEPQSFVSKYESGERRLDIIELRHICKCIGVSLEDFVKQFERRLNES